MNAVKELRET